MSACICAPGCPITRSSVAADPSDPGNPAPTVTPTAHRSPPVGVSARVTDLRAGSSSFHIARSHVSSASPRGPETVVVSTSSKGQFGGCAPSMGDHVLLVVVVATAPESPTSTVMRSRNRSTTSSTSRGSMGTWLTSRFGRLPCRGGAGVGGAGPGGVGAGGASCCIASSIDAPARASAASACTAQNHSTLGGCPTIAVSDARSRHCRSDSRSANATSRPIVGAKSSPQTAQAGGRMSSE